MGSCFSATATTAPVIIDESTAKVVSAYGSLVEYSAPVRVSQVLGLDYLSSFLCNSDSLCYDTYILALQPEDFIQLGNLYFILPIDKLEHTLSGSDMAALAIKASSALASVNKSSRRSRGMSSSVRVMPVAEKDGNVEYKRFNEDSVGFSSLRRSKSVQKQTRRSNASRAKMMHRRKLSAIEELAE